MRYGYRHTIGVITLFIIFIIGCVTVASAQVVTGSPNTPSGYSIDSVTGNLISNGALTSGTGWASTTGSPTWTPNGAPLGSFDPVNGYTFSYTSESLGQNPGINLAGFSHGYLNSSAVFVTGFMYGLQYRFPCANSIGTNCDGTAQLGFTANPLQDNLRVEVGYYPYSGSPTFYTHQLGLKNINDGNSPYNPTWQQLAQTVTFAGAKPLAQAGSVNFEIIGQDAGFWGCNPNCYGPQVKDAYIRAMYSVDPCILNPAFNPSCSGFQNVLQGSKSPAFYYSYNIAQSLPHIGGGVILHGYDYGFNWYNYGACYNTFLFWCTDWRTDGGGNINFRISDKNNTTMFQNQWYVAGNNSGGSYTSRHLFTESRNSLDMGTVQWWTSNVWNHFGWVGWTRPIWTPDPCYTNGLYSPNCSNFQDAVNKVLADIKTQQEKIASLSPTTSSVTTTPGGTITTTVNADPVNPTVSVSTEPTSSTSALPSSSRSESSASTLSTALNLISRNQQRENSIATQASQNAISAAASAASASMTEAESLAQTAASNSQSNESATEQKTEVNSQRAVEIAGFNMPAPGSGSVVSTAVNTQRTMGTSNQDTQNNANSSSTSAIVQFNAMAVDIASTTAVPLQLPNPPPVTINIANSITYVPPQQDTKISEQTISQEPIPIRNDFQITLLAPVTSQPTETATVIQSYIIPVPTPILNAELPTVGTNFISDRTNPITEIIENKQPTQEQSSSQTKTETVKSNVQDNDAASGGVSIGQIAVLPVGFSAYSIVLADAAFYAPKEIYRNQRTVDNARALRQLASDRLHQEMVDQQYRR